MWHRTALFFSEPDVGPDRAEGWLEITHSLGKSVMKDHQTSVSVIIT